MLKNMVLLYDTLERTLAEPQCAHRWHRLITLWRETPEQTARQRVLLHLTSLPGGDPRADVLRFTFLATVTCELRFADAAAAQVLAIQPSDPDRLAAFMAYPWLDALTKLPGRTDFVAALTGARLPEMAVRLARHVTTLLPASLTPRAPQAIERVAIVTPYAGNRFHTPSVMTTNQCTVLARENRRVHVFSCQELLPPEIPLYRGDGGGVLLPPPNLATWENTLPAGVGISFSDSRFSLTPRWRDMLPLVASFDPDVVLLVGLYSPLAAALYTVRPVVGLSVNTVPPIAPTDVWLTANETEAGQPLEPWNSAFPPSQARFHPYRVHHHQGPWRVSRTELELSEEAVVWITTGFRLKNEVSGSWAARMVELLSRYPHAVWLLVGGDGTLPEALLRAPPGRIRALATRDDAVGVLALCDIYVNPPRMGGGFSVAEAMAEGLPALAFASSDGGDKVGELALTEMDAYFSRLADLTENPTLRSEMGQALRARFAERFDLNSSGPNLIAACEQAAANAEKRLTPTAS